jgi:hypothetical protein
MQDIAMALPLIDHYGNSIPEKAVFFKKPNCIVSLRPTTSCWSKSFAVDYFPE